MQGIDRIVSAQHRVTGDSCMCRPRRKDAHRALCLGADEHLQLPIRTQRQLAGLLVAHRAQPARPAVAPLQRRRGNGQVTAEGEGWLVSYSVGGEAEVVHGPALAEQPVGVRSVDGCVLVEVVGGVRPDADPRIAAAVRQRHQLRARQRQLSRLKALGWWLGWGCLAPLGRRGRRTRQRPPARRAPGARGSGSPPPGSARPPAPRPPAPPPPRP